jgi:hypothetical protein
MHVSDPRRSLRRWQAVLHALLLRTAEGVGVTASSLPVKRCRGPVSARARDRFLGALAGGATIEEAAASAGRPKQTFYRLRSTDETFATEWRAAIWERAEPIEALFQRVAVEGWDEFEYDGKGDLVRRHHRWSPRPGEVLLKASRPELYRDGVSVDVTERTVIVLESAFQGRPVIEAEVVESTAVELPDGEAA